MYTILHNVIYGSATLSVSNIAPSSVKVQGDAVHHVTIVDVNCDGILDLYALVPMNNLSISNTTTSLPVTGVLKGGRRFQGTAAVTVVAHGDNHLFGCTDDKGEPPACPNAGAGDHNDH